MHRRDFLKLLALQAAAWSLGCARSGDDSGRAPRQAAPELPPNPYADRWMGDDFSRGHPFRDGTLPSLAGGARRESVDVLVVGGGISGLVAARTLARQGRRVRVLEQAAVAGGNAKSARWGELEYAIGAAYVTRPDAGSELDVLYRELGVFDEAVKVPKGEALFDGKMLEDFWGGESDPANAASTVRVRDALRHIFEERYPAIPWTPGTPGWTRAQFRHADRESFSAWLERHAAPPHVRQFCEYYCWSSFGGAATEISSYAALNFISAEFGDILALPGGNAGIVRRLVADLAQRGVVIETGRFVASVESAADGVVVGAFAGVSPELHVAKAVVVAVPRFLAKRMVKRFPASRAAIAATLQWRAYLVANVLLGRRPKPSWYDAYRVEPLDAHTSGWTDLILADYVASSKHDYAVLTAYRALPYEGGRSELLTDADYPRHRDAVRRDLVPWLPALGLEASDIHDINLARWGHPLILAKPGQLSGGQLERLSAPLGRVAFAQQDRYGVPAIENAIAAGFAAAREVESMPKI